MPQRGVVTINKCFQKAFRMEGAIKMRRITIIKFMEVFIFMQDKAGSGNVI